MKYAEINKRFSEIAESYLAGGKWSIDTSALSSGYSGEKCRLALTDGKNIICIRIISERDYPLDTMTISVDFADEETLRKNFVRPNRKFSDTLWADRMTNVYSETYWQIGESYHTDWYGTKHEAETAIAIARGRRKYAAEWDTDETIDLTQKRGAKDIALKYIHREYYRSYKPADIEKVEKRICFYEGKATATYRIHAKGKIFEFAVRRNKGCRR